MDHLDSLFTVTTWSYWRDVFLVCNSRAKKQPGRGNRICLRCYSPTTVTVTSSSRLQPYSPGDCIHGSVLLRKDFCKLFVRFFWSTWCETSEGQFACWLPSDFRPADPRTGITNCCRHTQASWGLWPCRLCMGNYTLHVPFKVLEIPTGYQCLRIYRSAHTAVSRFGWN